MALFNDDSVLVRTSEGELAARQPRRVASNRARAALLLLDGQLSVGEMKRRFGETLAVDDALMELLRDGLAVDRDDVITDADDDLPVMNRQAGMEEPPTEMPVDPNLSIPPGFVIAGMPRSAASPESERDYRPSQPASVVSEPAEGELDVDASIDAAYASKSRPRPPPAAPVRPREPSVWPLLLDRARFHLTRGARGAMASAWGLTSWAARAWQPGAAVD